MSINVQVLADQFIKGPGFLLTLQLVEGNHGIMNVASFTKMKVMQHKQDTCCELTGANIWVGLQEPPDWSVYQREVEPENRFTAQTHFVARVFSQMDIIPTSNGSRFLSDKEFTYEEATIYVTHEPHTYVYYVPSIKELEGMLRAALGRLGVPDAPATDREVIQQDILKKLVVT